MHNFELDFGKNVRKCYAHLKVSDHKHHHWHCIGYILDVDRCLEDFILVVNLQTILHQVLQVSPQCIDDHHYRYDPCLVVILSPSELVKEHETSPHQKYDGTLKQVLYKKHYVQLLQHFNYNS